jgi:hypothetical protein
MLGKKEKTKRTKKDKDAPKRALTAYLFYSNAVRDQVKAANPGIQFGEVAQKISGQWKSITASEKSKYDKLAEKDKERYEKEKAAYEKAGGKSSSKASKKSKKEESEEENEESEEEEQSDE